MARRKCASAARPHHREPTRRTRRISLSLDDRGPPQQRARRHPLREIRRTRRSAFAIAAFAQHHARRTPKTGEEPFQGNPATRILTRVGTRLGMAGTAPCTEKQDKRQHHAHLHLMPVSLLPQTPLRHASDGARAQGMECPRLWHHSAQDSRRIRQRRRRQGIDRSGIYQRLVLLATR